MDKPLIFIEIEPHLADFLRHEFMQCKKSDALVVDGTNEIGMLIQAFVTVSDRPRKQEITENSIALELPTQSWNHAIFEENFVYIPRWKQKQLNLFIEATFRLRIKEFFQVGYEKGFKQDMIVRAFLENYNIKNNALNYDTIKKYDYRNRRKIVKQVSEEIQLSLKF